MSLQGFSAYVFVCTPWKVMCVCVYEFLLEFRNVNLKEQDGKYEKEGAVVG